MNTQAVWRKDKLRNVSLKEKFVRKNRKEMKNELHYSRNELYDPTPQDVRRNDDTFPDY
jgi:hypothetical protein